MLAAGCQAGESQIMEIISDTAPTILAKVLYGGGIHAGYNNQRGNTVFRIEASPQDIRRYRVC